MFDLPGIFGSIANLLVIVIGFGLIVFIHELGHFVAAKWAGIRVLAFSMGMGPVLLSYRKGIGLRRGSTDPEYYKLLQDAEGTSGDHARDMLSGKVSHTEYRLSALPLGGYVKMLGQEDLNPGAVSGASDSYQNTSVPKRLVVISAGVIMNVISAAILFVIVFMVGLQSNPPIVGSIASGSPAESATPINAAGIEQGLRRGDVITKINSSTVYGHRDILAAVAMSSKSRASEITVERQGVTDPIVFSVMPVRNEATGLLDLGIMPPQSTRVLSGTDAEMWSRVLSAEGLSGFNQGEQLVAVNGQQVDTPYAILDAASASDGESVTLSLRGESGLRDLVLPVERETQFEYVPIDDIQVRVEHILGLTGVLTVNRNIPPEDAQQGLRPGDRFVRIGSLMHPSQPQGVRKVRSLAGKPVEIEIMRGSEQLTLDVQVTPSGTIGFIQGSSFDTSNIVGETLALDKASGSTSPSLNLRPGTLILAIDELPIETLRDIAPAIIESTRSEYASSDAHSFELDVELQLPLPTQPDGTAPVVHQTWTLSRDEITQLMDLGWSLPGGRAVIGLFEPVIVVDKADDPIAAIRRGLHESKRVMAMTYLTFVRLFEGSVELKQLRGPVGIAHLGTQIADDGFMMVLFFMGLISINLAVINFLPLPIVDGGQFLMLLYEGIRGKPLPIPLQNAVTMLGLLLIAGVFLYITFHDVSRLLFGGL